MKSLKYIIVDEADEMAKKQELQQFLSQFKYYEQINMAFYLSTFGEESLEQIRTYTTVTAEYLYKEEQKEEKKPNLKHFIM